MAQSWLWDSQIAVKKKRNGTEIQNSLDSAQILSPKMKAAG